MLRATRYREPADLSLLKTPSLSKRAKGNLGTLIAIAVTQLGPTS
jgi:hypothetical protein